MIRHSVILKLKTNIISEQKAAFFEAVDSLKYIEGVNKFEVLRQTSQKNPFEYGISMEFDSQQDYDNYSNHPQHVAFVQNYWIPNVEDFLEIDYAYYKSE